MFYIPLSEIFLLKSSLWKNTCHPLRARITPLHLLCYFAGLWGPLSWHWRLASHVILICWIAKDGKSQMWNICCLVWYHRWLISTHCLTGIFTHSISKLMWWDIPEPCHVIALYLCAKITYTIRILTVILIDCTPGNVNWLKDTYPRECLISDFYTDEKDENEVIIF